MKIFRTKYVSLPVLAKHHFSVSLVFFYDFFCCFCDVEGYSCYILRPTGVSDNVIKAIFEKGAHAIDHGSKKSALKSLEEIVLF